MLSPVTTPQDLDERFHAELAQLNPTDSPTDPDEPVREGSGLTGALARELFQAQLVSRHLDLAARWLRSFDEGFYTIGSAGHEGNAAVAAAVSPGDPALLHHRSGAFYCARAATAPGADPMRDVLRGLVASANEPIAGGRQKVFGSSDLRIIPTTSAAAAHLPRAVGLAFALAQPRPLEFDEGDGSYAADAIVVCSFGDASANHANAAAALNTAGWFDHRGEKLPLLLVCEDNGLGISVASPEGWVPAVLKRPGLTYFEADGCDLAAAYDAAAEAAAFVRTERRPAVLRLTMVRLMGHTAADAEGDYRTPDDISAGLGRDPLIATAKLLVTAGVATPGELVGQYDEVGWEVRRVAEEVLAEPKLASAAEITAPLAPRRPVRVAKDIGAAAQVLEGAGEERARGTVGKLPEQAGGLTLAQTINSVLADALIANPDVRLFGADVAVMGGVNGVTRGLRDRFGPRRVFDTLLDETSIVGLGLGAGLGGLLPVPEIQYLSHLHTALDQVRGEAATMQFFSVGAYRNPLVLRVAGLGYQQGPGGHFQNDNALAALRDIPGLVIAVPARAEDAGPMLRTCLAAAHVDGSVCVFVEPLALYHTKDLYDDGDGLWLGEYDPPGEWTTRHVPIGRARVYPGNGGDDVTIITFGNGVRLSLRAAARLAEEGIGCRVLDLRWIGPLPVADIIRESAATGRVLVVDETRRSGGVGEGVIAALVDAGYVGAARRVAAVDSFIPLGPAARHVLVSEEQVVQGVRSLLAR